MNDSRRGGMYGPPLDILPLPAMPKPRLKREEPQESVKRFWDRFNTKYPGKVFTVLPDNPYALKKAAKVPKGAVQGQRAAKSYEEAAAECARDVDRIVRDCRRINQKYRDPHFDIEWDLKSGQRNCLDSLKKVSLDIMKPKGVKRVTDIFDNPQFYINGPTAGDVRQGRDGDCYFMAALCGLGNMKGLIDKVCVRHDVAVGVYGFVFYRDGEWQQCIVDDKLYLRAPDYDEAQEERVVWDDINRKDAEEEYRRTHQTGSRALYFAQCSDENETWLPLLEKAYAKAHGDYTSIDGGFTGEAIEDLTGGVTSEIYSTDILDKDAFWKNELMNVGKEFLFGCATGFYSNWLDPAGISLPRERQGISEGHAYSIMEAREIKGKRLLKLRNPWGKKEWDGRWSDGSSEWTPEWMQLLEHTFGNDGVFWISYEDLLKKYQHFDRTRIFGPEWNITQKWTSLHVPWSADYHSTKFKLTLKKKSPVVIVLSQLDDTYFCGLEGAYGFDLQFRLEDDKGDADDYIVRSNGNYAMARSVSADIELDAGTYSVLMKITATRNGSEAIEDVLAKYAARKREKLIQIGLSYDLAHAKGINVETEKERKEREANEKEQRAKDREQMKKEMRAQAEKEWKKRKAYYARDKKKRQKKERADAKRMAKGKPRRDTEEEENMDSMWAAHGGSESGLERGASRAFLPNGMPKGEADESKVPNHDKAIKLRSFNGEPIQMEPANGELEAEPDLEAAPDAEQNSVAEAVADTVESSANSHPQKLAEGVVQPLDEVIAIADAETAANSAATKDAKDIPPTPIVQVNGVDAVTDVKPLPNKPPLSSGEHNFDSSALASGKNEQVEQQDNPKAAAGLTVARDDDISDTDSFSSFDWQTHLDMSSDSSDSERSDGDNDVDDDDDDRDKRAHRRKRFEKKKILEIIRDDDEPDRDGRLGLTEPWNAVCVVGLRVYSQVSGEDLVLEVVRPGNGDGKKAKEDNKKKTGDPFMVVGALDRDDPGKGAVVALPVEIPVGQQSGGEESR